jgi:two-component system sensor kinase FixL
VSRSIDAPDPGFAARGWRAAAAHGHDVLLAAGVFGAYYLGALLGFALTFHPYPISVLWPPNALLFAALLLTPPRRWWIVLGAALPAHMLCELSAGVPVGMVLAWFMSNVTEAIVGALAFRALAKEPPQLDRLRHVLLFLLAAAVSVIASSFLDSFFVQLNRFGEKDFWEVWVPRIFSNLSADIVVIPAMLALASLWRGPWRGATRMRLVEGMVLLAGLLAVTLAVFNMDMALTGSPAQLYLPVMFLLWAALRFGSAATSLGFAAIAISAIWGAGHGTGALGARSPLENAHSVQLLVLSMGPVLLCLAAAIAEFRGGAESMRASDRRFRLVLEATTDTVYERDVGTGSLWWSRNGRSHLGYAKMAELPRTALGLVNVLHPEDQKHVLDLQDSALRDGSNTWEVEFRLRRADGSYVHVQERAFIIRDSVGAPVYVTGMLTDLTEERDIEELDQRLSHASRLTTMGELAASIAHEINQPISAILMNVEAARLLLERDDADWRSEFRTILRDIGEDDLRASEIVRHFRGLATRHSPAVESFDVNEVVRSVMRLATPTARRRGVALRAEQAAIPFARADRIHLQQVLLNLLFNGMDAMNQPGSRERALTVKTGPFGDDMIRVCVRDTGHGISDGALPQIFESFYTTKADGLGLGLSIARSLVSGWGGRLWAENNEQGGATFTFTVPASIEGLGRE